MKSGIRIWRVMLFCGILFSFSSQLVAGEKKLAVSLLPVIESVHADSLFSRPDTLSVSPRFFHNMEVDIRPGYVFPTNSFLRGVNDNHQAISRYWSTQLKYSFQFQPNTLASRIYGGAYQGVGIAHYTFGNRKELGNPLAFYLFQGARIVSLVPRLSFNYEWNFGFSLGWKHYHPESNRYNVMMGSKMNAYINTNFYLNWLLSPQFDLRSGVTLTHFSNGNTRFPNAGINLIGLKLGLVYHFKRTDPSLASLRNQRYVPEFPRHMSYDLVVFGSWRRKGYFSDGGFVPSPKAYRVMGANLAAMYNVSYKFRAGIALDWVYDASANVFVLSDPGTPEGFVKPPFNAQIALGVSGRAEFVMPYFTVGIGMGSNVLHRGGDLEAFYQMLVLKIAVTRSSFLHIGYSLKNFQTPNFLMLGIGYRFNNKYPVLNR